MKLTDDVASVNPNISNLNFQVNLDDPENCLHSEGIKTMPEEKGFAKYFEDGQFDVAQTYGASINNTGMGSWARYIQGRRLLYGSADRGHRLRDRQGQGQE